MNKIKIDRDRVIGKVNRNIFGLFFEHYHKIIYEGIVDEGSKKIDNNYFRTDVIDAFKELQTPMIRWPGGNFSSGYHWEDGVGPISQRPIRLDLEWQAEESNKFGTGEFIKYCTLVNCKPYICVNAGSGTAEEAAHWVEYCNIKGNSYYAKLRENYGDTEPYNVRFWGIGNELYGRGQIGRKDIDNYIDCVKEFSKLMKKVDPTIKLVVVGFEKTEWNFKLVKEAGEYFDYISVHSYHIGSEDKSYEETAALSLITEEQLYEMQSSIAAASYYIKDRRTKPIQICFDEWNLREWSHEKYIEWMTLAFQFSTYNKELLSKNSVLAGKSIPDTREEMLKLFDEKRSSDEENCKITVADAIYTSCVINGIMRKCNYISLGGFSPAINGKGLFSSLNDRIVKRPTYHVFDLYSKFTGDIVLDAYVSSGYYNVFINSTPYNINRVFEVPYIDAAASLEADGKKLYISVINRNKENSEECNILTDGFEVENMKVHEIHNNSYDDYNDISSPDNVHIKHYNTTVSGKSFYYTFPPHSVTILELSVI